MTTTDLAVRVITVRAKEARTAAHAHFICCDGQVVDALVDGIDALEIAAVGGSIPAGFGLHRVLELLAVTR